MKVHRRSNICVVFVLLGLVCSPSIVLGQYEPGSTVEFGQVDVRTSSPEILVVRIRYPSTANNTVAVIVGGQGFRRGPASTCPTVLRFLRSDCIVTVVFEPTSLGAKTGEVVASYGLCSYCPNQRWNLRGTGVVSRCDINADLRINGADVQLIVNQALGLAPAVTDLNNDGRVNVLDVQLLVNAALGRGCATAGR